MAPTRREQLVDRLADSALMQKVIGPKVLKPAAEWYEAKADRAPVDEYGDHVRAPDSGHNGDVEEGDAPQPAVIANTPASPTLASAKAAEAFFAGPDAAGERVGPSRPQSSFGPTTQSAGVSSAAASVPLTGAKAFKDLALQLKTRVQEHNLTVVAAGIAFWGLLAIPAVFTAVLSIYGLFAEEAEVEQQIENNLSALPEDARSIITGQLESVAGASQGGLAVGAVIGILLALWTCSGAVAKVIATLNTIWDVVEDRKFLKLRGLAVLITFGAVAFVAAAAFLLAVLPAVLGEVGLGDLGRWLLNAGRFPALLVFMALGLTILYRVGPNRPSPYRLFTWGAIVATVLWVMVSGIFSIYTASFASYNETYGSLGAVVILLMWLFLTAFMVLLGAEIDAARSEIGQKGDL